MDDVGRLIKLAGEREPVERERFERVRKNVHEHWQQVQQEQNSAPYSYQFRIIAIAASLLFVVGAVFIISKLPPAPEPDSLASIERVLGEVKIAGNPVIAGDVINTDTTIITGKDSRIALRMSGGQSIRIDAASRVVIDSANRISLDSGAVYIDTGLAPEKSMMLIATPLGTAMDIGTQFQVRMDGMVMVVGVRRGVVKILQDDQFKLEVDSGHSVELDVNGASASRALERNDPDWDWIETVVPEFDIQGSTLAQYLEWYSSELALDLVWIDEVSEKKAASTMLKGSINGTSLEQGLMMVKQIAPFEHDMSDGMFRVNVK